MPSTEIPRKKWSKFLEKFTRDHQGWLTTVERHCVDSGTLTEAADLPLEGIMVNLKHHQEALSLVVGNKDLPHRHLLHSIEAVIEIRLEESSPDADKALHVRSTDGRTTIVRFRRVVTPEHVPDRPRSIQS
jgi:hypothetical protein